MVAGLARDMQPAVDIAHLEHLIPQKDFARSKRLT
jgi:hypothetical protein